MFCKDGYVSKSTRLGEPTHTAQHGNCAFCMGRNDNKPLKLLCSFGRFADVKGLFMSNLGLVVLHQSRHLQNQQPNIASTVWVVESKLKLLQQFMFHSNLKRASTTRPSGLALCLQTCRVRTWSQSKSCGMSDVHNNTVVVLLHHLFLWCIILQHGLLVPIQWFIITECVKTEACATLLACDVRGSGFHWAYGLNEPFTTSTSWI